MNSLLSTSQQRSAQKAALVLESARLRAQLAADLHSAWRPVQIVSTAWRVLRMPSVWMLIGSVIRRWKRPAAASAESAPAKNRAP